MTLIWSSFDGFRRCGEESDYREEHGSGHWGSYHGRWCCCCCLDRTPPAAPAPQIVGSGGSESDHPGSTAPSGAPDASSSASALTEPSRTHTHTHTYSSPSSWLNPGSVRQHLSHHHSHTNDNQKHLLQAAGTSGWKLLNHVKLEDGVWLEFFPVKKHKLYE